MTLATVIGIDPIAKSDGSLVLQIKDATGQDTTAIIPAAMVAAVQSALQRILVEHVYSVAKVGELTIGVALPQFTIEQVATAHLHDATTLCGLTSQMGWVSLEASNDVLRRMKQEIDMVLSSSRVKH
jgi:hypothetical protein